MVVSTFPLLWGEMQVEGQHQKAGEVSCAATPIAAFVTADCQRADQGESAGRTSDSTPFSITYAETLLLPIS